MLSAAAAIGSSPIWVGLSLIWNTPEAAFIIGMGVNGVVAALLFRNRRVQRWLGVP